MATLKGLRPVWLAVSLSLLATGCKTGNSPSSKAQALARDSKPAQGQNIALIIAAAAEGDAIYTSVASDTEIFEDLFAKVGFAVQVIRNPSVPAFERALESAAVKAGRDGTLLLAYSGHADDTGAWIMDSPRTRVPLQLVTTTLRQARKSQKLRRLILMSDSCFSGQVIREPALNPVQDPETSPAEQTILLASSHPNRPTETFLGGGALARGLSVTLPAALRNKHTVRQWLNDSLKWMQGYSEYNLPHFAAHPLKALDEPVLDQDGGNGREKAQVKPRSCQSNLYGKSWADRFRAGKDACPDADDLCICWPGKSEGFFSSSRYCSIFPPQTRAKTKALVSVELSDSEACDASMCQQLFMKDYQLSKGNCGQEIIFVNDKGELDTTSGVPGLNP